MALASKAERNRIRDLRVGSFACTGTSGETWTTVTLGDFGTRGHTRLASVSWYVFLRAVWAHRQQLQFNYGDQKAHLAYWNCAMVTPCYHWYARQDSMPIGCKQFHQLIIPCILSVRSRHSSFFHWTGKKNKIQARQRPWPPATSSRTARHNDHNTPAHASTICNRNHYVLPQPRRPLNH